MGFEVTPNVHVQRDEEGVVTQLRHSKEPYEAEQAGVTAPTPLALANEYLRDVADVYQLETEMLSSLTEGVAEEPSGEGVEIRFTEEKRVKGTTTVSYDQTVSEDGVNLPIWDAGVAVRVQDQPLRVTSSDSTLHRDVRVEMPPEDAEFVPENIDAGVLAELLDIPDDEYEIQGINETRLLVYQYDPDARVDPESEPVGEIEVQPLEAPPPTLPLPPVPDEIEPGNHYVVTDVLFTMSVPDQPDLNWRAFVEPETGAVLYLRALTASWTGAVYERDPVTATGDHTITPASSASILDSLRTNATLSGLTSNGNPDGSQELRGQYISMEELQTPTEDSPAISSGSFTYSVPTGEFGAVNAYYHCDRLYRLMESFGFDVDEYFDGTTFPIPVDHRAWNNQVNASAPGNATSDGLGRYLFGRAMATSTVSMATAWRIVLHEFGHALLWDHVDSPNFGFAHSAGDSLAAILNDPGSLADDRFMTFPWISGGTPGIDRRHDRPADNTWGWGGSRDDGGYGSEQILSTTHFRIYSAIGGNDASEAMQRSAARYLAYLIIYAIGTLTPSNRANTPGEFATALIDADDGTLEFEDHPGSTLDKVIEWGFEKQRRSGTPPKRDVYIDDGRGGEYGYLRRFWNTQDVWNRRNPDGGATHQTPATGATNYAYVRVRNRGTETAPNVTVRGYHSKLQAGQVWPDDWQPMDTRKLSAGSLSPSGQTVVGPFEWTPELSGGSNMLMSVEADGDPSNLNAPGSIPTYHLVPFDNNVAQRSVATVPGVPNELAERLDHVQFSVRNPFDRTVNVSIETDLPELLEERDWQAELVSEAAPTFELGPKAQRDVTARVRPGGEFAPEDVRFADETMEVSFELLADGLPVGGISYALEPAASRPTDRAPSAWLAELRRLYGEWVPEDVKRRLEQFRRELREGTGR